MAKNSLLRALLKRKKKTVKPTTEEQRKLTARLKRKYPQMYETVASHKEEKQMGRLSPGDRAEYIKLIGKTLKKKYKGK